MKRFFFTVRSSRSFLVLFSFVFLPSSCMPKAQVRSTFKEPHRLKRD